MAGSLKGYHWDDQPLDGEVAHFADDIIVEGSDAEDSPSTKSERRQRREAIGRRYLRGHIPFIQSASLHGPLGPESGWENPWKRRQKTGLAQPFRKSIRAIHESKRIRAPLEERESKVPRGELQTITYAERKASSEPYHGYTSPHDQDSGDDILEITPWVGYTENHDGVQDNFQAKSASSSPDNTLPAGNIDDILKAPQEDQERLKQRTCAKGRRVIATASEQAQIKRKADTSWLKGTHMLKRSRYEILEYSSPTPAAGTGRTIIAQGVPSSSPPVSFTIPQKNIRTPRAVSVRQADIDAWPPLVNVIIPSSTARNLSEMDHLTACDLEAVKGSGMRQIEQPLENGTGMTFSCNEIAFDELGPRDVQGLLAASHLALGTNSPTAIPKIHKRRLEIAELSASDPDDKEIASLMEVRQRSHERVVSNTSTAKAQDSNRLNLNVRESKAFPSSDISASEGSFQYRRRNRKSKRKKKSPKPQSIAETEGNVREFSNQMERQGFEDAEYDTTNLNDDKDSHSQRWSKSCNGDDNKRTSEISTELHVTELEKSWKQGVSHATDLDSGAEVTDVSSPDPLGEDLVEIHKFQTSMSGNNFQAASVAEKASINAQSTKSHLKRTSEADLNLAEELEFQQQHQSEVSFDAETQQLVISRSFRDCSVSSGQPDFSPKHQKSDICMEYDPLPAVSAKLEDLPHGETPEVKAVGLPEENDNIRPSPWMDVGSEGLQLDLSGGSSTKGPDNGESHNYAEIRANNAHTNDILSNKLSSDVQKELPTMEFTSMGGKALSSSQSVRKQHRELSNVTTESLGLFPSTQVLIDAATANPWNSSMTKSKSGKSVKRVSFGPLPSDDIDNSLPQPALNVTERLQSPPPPEEALRLTHLDDGFHYQLRATRNLESAGESLTRIMDTPWEEMPAMTSRAKAPHNSPAVGAMAEAFIAADRENLPKNSDMSGRAKPGRATLTRTETGGTSESWSRTVPQQQETRSHSPLDASFSIAPSGKVTAVNFDVGVSDAEDNLDAMIDDVGSFFEGWDVDSELKKAKGTKPEKRCDPQKGSRREYLSGLSNR